MMKGNNVTEGNSVIDEIGITKGNVTAEAERRIAYLAFTERGRLLAEQLRAVLGGTVSCTRHNCGTASCTCRSSSLTLSGWTAENFPAREALVYVGAVGIAVRAVAPHLKGKAVDPAVVAVDETGRFAVPLVSGHLGGANDLARQIAAVTGGIPVITTATDCNGVFAVDEWARRQNCAVIQPERIKFVSGKRLADRTLRLFSRFSIAGTPPEGVELVIDLDGKPATGEEFAVGAEPATDVEPAINTGEDIGANNWADIGVDIWVDVFQPPALERTPDRISHGEPVPAPHTLAVAPRALFLGVGCRRGTATETLERQFAAFCAEARLWPQAFCAAATIRQKTQEPGLLSFCAGHHWPLRGYSAEELGRVPGAFTPSAFVEQQVGVDNVCERAAVLDSGGVLLIKKYAGNGVTLAAALGPVALDWSWETSWDC